MTTLPFDYIAIWPADDEGAGYRRRFVIEGKGLVKTQLANAVPTGQSMLQLQVSSSCARRFQTIARPFREAVQSFQASRLHGFSAAGSTRDQARYCPYSEVSRTCPSASKQMRRWSMAR